MRAGSWRKHAIVSGWVAIHPRTIPLTGFCLTCNPGTVGAAYGFAEMGPYRGGQADLLRVPYAEFNALVLPEDAAEKEDDSVMLSDIFPTGGHATELAGLLPGETVAIYGAGPVGLMAAHSAMIKGASEVFVVDSHDDRLRLAAEFGTQPIDMRRCDPTVSVKDRRQRACVCKRAAGVQPRRRRIQEIEATLIPGRPYMQTATFGSRVT